MNNAEYEGLISGRMFNNRLQINGQFGYRDNKNATTSFIGDFDVRYLLFPMVICLCVYIIRQPIGISQNQASILKVLE